MFVCRTILNVNEKTDLAEDLKESKTDENKAKRLSSSQKVWWKRGKGEMLHLTFEKQKKTNNKEETDKEKNSVFVPRNQNVCLSKVIDREGTVESQRITKQLSSFKINISIDDKLNDLMILACKKDIFTAV